MFNIEYSFSNINYIDSKDVNENTFRYDLFLGNIILKEGNSAIFLDWGWVPILDFAECLIDIYANLFQTNSVLEEFDFTESDGKLIFNKKNKTIKITTSFSEENLEVKEEEFKLTIFKFYKEVVYDILVNNQELINNVVFNTYLKKAQDIII